MWSGARPLLVTDCTAREPVPPLESRASLQNMQDSGESSSWGSADVVAQFSTEGFTDEGERAALESVISQRHGDVLDIGVGGGRTAGLLLGDSRSYVGLDVTPAMVELARRRFPHADLRVGDARELTGVPDHHFDLVMFSYNGLDALDHADRGQALAAMARVVAPTGRVLFSSLNLDGISFDERPWRLGALTSRRSRYHLAYAARHPSSMIRSVRNYQRTRLEAEDGPGWGRRPLRAHEFRFVVHFATMGETVAEARAAGLEVVAAYADTGEALDPTKVHTSADYVHFVCGPVS
jgi:SAM-dependent methyltransferase